MPPSEERRLADRRKVPQGFAEAERRSHWRRKQDCMDAFWRAWYAGPLTVQNMGAARAAIGGLDPVAKQAGEEA
jgi:hypothetical protein